MSSNPGTVYIVEDDELVRDLLGRLVQSVGLRALSLDNAQALLALGEFASPACIIMDMRLPGMGGLQLQAELRRRGRVPPIIFLSGHGDADTVAQAFRSGAFDFLEKPIRQQRVLERVQAALAHHVKLLESTERRDRARQRIERLSAREKEVLRHLVRGEPSKVIASQLGLSKKTVDLHRSNVLKKLEVSSTAELIRLTIDAGFEEVANDGG